MTEIQNDLFSLPEGLRRKDEGMRQAADNDPTTLEYAREIAKMVARINGTVTADDVRLRLDESGYGHLGPAAGSLFRGPDWIFTGDWRTSDRISNHARMNRVWRLRNV